MPEPRPGAGARALGRRPEPGAGHAQVVGRGIGSRVEAVPVGPPGKGEVGEVVEQAIEHGLGRPRRVGFEEQHAPLRRTRRVEGGADAAGCGDRAHVR
ncbi:hypothetical protein, partial [Methylobacterium sp. WL93]|uniref:hypothetical protein n=1 Tax=Methylobacterium sp. WL93 TaxID=2603892 RepID=UPI001FF07948